MGFNPLDINLTPLPVIILFGYVIITKITYKLFRSDMTYPNKQAIFILILLLVSTLFSYKSVSLASDANDSVEIISYAVSPNFKHMAILSNFNDTFYLDVINLQNQVKNEYEKPISDILCNPILNSSLFCDTFPFDIRNLLEIYFSQDSSVLYFQLINSYTYNKPIIGFDVTNQKIVSFFNVPRGIILMINNSLWNIDAKYKNLTVNVYLSDLNSNSNYNFSLKESPTFFNLTDNAVPIFASISNNLKHLILGFEDIGGNNFYFNNLTNFTASSNFTNMLAISPSTSYLGKLFLIKWFENKQIAFFASNFDNQLEIYSFNFESNTFNTDLNLAYTGQSINVDSNISYFSIGNKLFKITGNQEINETSGYKEIDSKNVIMDDSFTKFVSIEKSYFLFGLDNHSINHISLNYYNLNSNSYAFQNQIELNYASNYFFTFINLFYINLLILVSDFVLVIGFYFQRKYLNQTEPIE